MLRKKEKSPDIVETECTCANEKAESVPSPGSDAREVQVLSMPSIAEPPPATLATRDSRSRFSKIRLLAQKIATTTLLIVLAAMVCRQAINSWLDYPSIRIGRAPERQDWINRASKMSPWEAMLTQAQLQCRIAALHSPVIRALRPAGRISNWYEGADADLARLALFFGARHQTDEAIAALEQSVHISDLLLTESPGRWTYLLKLYLQKKDYQKAAILVERVSRLSSYVRDLHGDELQFHQMAQDVYDKAGLKEKADQERRQSELDNLTPSRFYADRSAIVQLMQLREMQFKYVWRALDCNHPRDALPVLEELLSNKLALSERLDSPELLAAVRMMLPIAQLQSDDWVGAEKSFPVALRLAAAEANLEYGHGNAKPALYSAYARFLEHQRKSTEAGEYRKKAVAASQALPYVYSFEDGEAVPQPYDERDLYPPESM